MKPAFCLLNLLSILNVVFAMVNPIEVRNRHFFDSVTDQPFFIKGVDYQPGGSSGVNDFWDPLSDTQACARDISIFQQLGINTIRVYSINPSLNHDKCMTMLAAAGIYLVLDVNSPKEGQHLNRYDPWTTYNPEYLTHVFSVVQEFSGYNNTLAFFAGNEIVNDKVSASASPIYVKAVVRDMKDYIAHHSPRTIPVGYSAADDLSYRISLADYMECYQYSPSEAVDFYGVNTYQWCGDATFFTSGYNILVQDYSHYSKPIFFSEYGCNEVRPRQFKEMGSIYSTQMSGVFSGGLVYEYAQEANNYGLVDFDEKGNVYLLPDFFTFKSMMAKSVDPPIPKSALVSQSSRSSSARGGRAQNTQKACGTHYDNLDISKGVPKSLGTALILKGVNATKGSYVSLSEQDLVSSYSIFKPDGALLRSTSVKKKEEFS
ncbi:unnamed protein product [Ambrosiozyma monospora]|uniref:Unnamed protein product n=1 Tax=Ambrosiozyma monospora TaxID=43982 RepID=A0ACB5SV08_AMBMO|nr:unnamed protein product [Ambrosiozyma monospora]